MVVQRWSGGSVVTCAPRCGIDAPLFSVRHTQLKSSPPCRTERSVHCGRFELRLRHMWGRRDREICKVCLLCEQRGADTEG